jgi:phage baseplate assembly protein W
MTKIYNTRVIAQNKVTVGDDVRTFTYKGFSSKEYKKNFKLYDFELAKQDLINHFNIRKGEKLENPNFGTIIWDILFEQFTDKVREDIAKDVERIINFDKRLKVETLEIDTTQQGIRLQANLLYVPDNLRDVLQIDFDKRNGIK